WFGILLVGLRAAEAGRLDGHVGGWRCQRGLLRWTSPSPGGIAEARGDEWVRPGERDVGAQLGRHDLDDGGEPRERLAGDGVTDELQQALALCVGDRPADDDPVRVEG